MYSTNHACQISNLSLQNCNPILKSLILQTQMIASGQGGGKHPQVMPLKRRHDVRLIN